MHMHRNPMHVAIFSYHSSSLLSFIIQFTKFIFHERKKSKIIAFMHNFWNSFDSRNFDILQKLTISEMLFIFVSTQLFCHVLIVCLRVLRSRTNLPQMSFRIDFLGGLTHEVCLSEGFSTDPPP